jgi:hypothetical protein
VLALGVVDYATAPEMAFSIFYLPPIAFIAWSAGKAGGLAIAG